MGQLQLTSPNFSPNRRWTLAGKLKQLPNLSVPAPPLPICLGCFHHGSAELRRHSKAKTGSELRRKRLAKKAKLLSVLPDDRNISSELQIGGAEVPVRGPRGRHRRTEELNDRMKNIKKGLLAEATLDPTGLFADRLRRLFGGGN